MAVVSHLRPDDEDLHYCDGSHRWIASPEFDQHAWAAQVRAHMQEHLRSMGGPPEPAEVIKYVPRRLGAAQPRRNRTA